MPLARSFAFHLLAPYATHLGLVYLLFLPITSDLGFAFLLILAFGGWLAVLLCIPFGVLHVLQAIYYAPGWVPAPSS